ncbi:unnamed protein product, partial [Ectocarpus sp. 13 AM-2016]
GIEGGGGGGWGWPRLHACATQAQQTKPATHWALRSTNHVCSPTSLCARDQGSHCALDTTSRLRNPSIDTTLRLSLRQVTLYGRHAGRFISLLNLSDREAKILDSVWDPYGRVHPPRGML